MSQNADTMSVMKSPQPQPADQTPHGPDLGYDPSKPIMTLGDLLDSPLVGLWDDPDDERSSAEIARDLRERNQRRDHR